MSIKKLWGPDQGNLSSQLKKVRFVIRWNPEDNSHDVVNFNGVLTNCKSFDQARAWVENYVSKEKVTSQDRIKALAEHLHLKQEYAEQYSPEEFDFSIDASFENSPPEYSDWIEEQILESKYNANVLNAQGKEYLVLTMEEAEERAKGYIEESVWAFNASFLVAHVPNGITEEFIQTIQEKLCEDANEGLKAMITDWDHFVSDAISSDGVAHFLNTYDGKEEEVKIVTESGEKTELYIYRIN